MYKIEVQRPYYLETDILISSEPYLVSEFIKDKLIDLNCSENKDQWIITITPSNIKYLGEDNDY